MGAIFAAYERKHPKPTPGKREKHRIRQSHQRSNRRDEHRRNRLDHYHALGPGNAPHAWRQSLRAGESNERFPPPRVAIDRLLSLPTAAGEYLRSWR
jgi:hypothetical protein